LGLFDDASSLSSQVIGAAIEVYKHLGPGYLEAVYEEALAIEMTGRKISYERQFPVAVSYKGHPVGETRLDFLVDRRLIVELKAVEQLHGVHSAQILSYLKVTQLRLGLLINFNVKVLKDGVKRVVLD
jgi:GxxExxY protein